MIILDTNVVSEFMTSSPDKRVLAWVNSQLASHLYLTVISVAEIQFGLMAMPKGKRQVFLSDNFDVFLKQGFTGRILDFDINAAKHYGLLMGKRRLAGTPMSALDGQIASIAKNHDFSIATRNVKDFVDCNLDIINPFN